MSEVIIRLKTVRFLRPSLETGYSCLRIMGLTRNTSKIFVLIGAREGGRTLD